MGRYTTGARVKVNITFAGSTDPSVVKLTVLRPVSRVRTTYQYGIDLALVRDAAGKYHIVFDTIGEPGTWLYRVESTAPNSVRESSFLVRPSDVV